MKYAALNFAYKGLVKPALFLVNPEIIHELVLDTGYKFSQHSLTSNVFSKIIRYENSFLEQKINNIDFVNPIGLAAGFDYDGKLAAFMYDLGFGFNTVGTVTNKFYEGNKRPMLMRLPKDKALLVNKGFKSSGSGAVSSRISELDIKTKALGVSIGSSNVPEVSTIHTAIADYCKSLLDFADIKNIAYFEINISCPNTSMPESFVTAKNFKALVNQMTSIQTKIPFFIKMPSVASDSEIDEIVKISLEFGINTFIFSNLAKDRQKVLSTRSLKKIKTKKGNISGKPVQSYSNELISSSYKKYKDRITIIGCGGVFNAVDAYKKIKLGASLVQLITGMIYEGPQLAAQINKDLVKLASSDGFSCISEAIGVDSR